MSNLDFFKACWSNELAATQALIAALPTERLDFRPHPVNRSAYEIVEHLLGHAVDLKVIATTGQCDETLKYDVGSSAAAAAQYGELAAAVTAALAGLTDQQWEQEPVELHMLDISGREVTRQWYLADRSESTITLDVSDLAGGIYQLKIKALNSSETYFVRFIKSH